FRLCDLLRNEMLVVPEEATLFNKKNGWGPNDLRLNERLGKYLEARDVSLDDFKAANAPTITNVATVTMKSQIKDLALVDAGTQVIIPSPRKYRDTDTLTNFCSRHNVTEQQLAPLNPRLLIELKISNDDSASIRQETIVSFVESHRFDRG